MSDMLLNDNILLITGTVFAGVVAFIIAAIAKYFISSSATPKIITNGKVANGRPAANGNGHVHSHNNNHYTNGKAFKVNGTRVHTLQHIKESDESEPVITQTGAQQLKSEPKDLVVSEEKSDVESDKDIETSPCRNEVELLENKVLDDQVESDVHDREVFEDRDEDRGQNNHYGQEVVEEVIQSDHVNSVSAVPEVATLEEIKDFAAIILTDDERKDFFEIVCITSGSDVIEAHNLEPEFVVIDCRAPVLARRALLRYLYRKLTEVVTHEVTEEESIFTAIPASNRFELKKNMRLNLFVSEPPDSRSPLRGNASPRLKSVIDKIGVWNQVGVQGSLLSHFLDPIYINSVIIPFEFSDKTFHRHFVLNYTKEPKLTKCKDSLIDDIRRRVERVRTDGWSGRLATNWIASEPTIEMIDCTTGRAVSELSTGAGASRLSKHSMMECFRQFLSAHENSVRVRTGLINRPNQSLPMTYRKWKESAPNYRIQKQLLKVRYAVAGREWPSLSPELDDFQ